MQRSAAVGWLCRCSRGFSRRLAVLAVQEVNVVPQADPLNGRPSAAAPPRPERSEGSAARPGLGWLAEWLPAGLGLRPWAALLVLSLALVGLGLAMLVTNLYRMFVVWQTGTPLLYWATLQ